MAPNAPGSPTLQYALSKRHLPRSHTEAIPAPDYDSDDNSSINPSSYRANFLAAGAHFATDSHSDIYGSLKDHSPYVSPVFQNLHSIHQHKLTERSASAQILRRKLLRASNVLIVQGGYFGKCFIYKRLKALGVNLYILDGPSSVWKTLLTDGTIAGFIEVDFTENDTVLERALDALSISALHLKLDAVTTYFEDAVALASHIAVALGVDTNPVEACERARNKRRTREVMRDCGLPVPKFRQIVCADDIEAACNHVGFPLIMKPVFGAASMGVTKATCLSDALAAYAKLFETLNVDEDTIWAQGTEMIIEEYYDGDEFDIDLLLSDGVVVYAKMSDNWACWEPWFQETGTNCPSLYPQEKQEELVELSIASTMALGFRNGCFHVECRYTKRGPRLIEVNARMGGVSVRDANLIAWGVDLVEEHCMSALQIPIRPAVPDTPLRFMAETVINAPYSGVVTSNRWLDFMLDSALIHKISYIKQRGDMVNGPEDGVPDWIAEAIVVSDRGAHEAIREIQRLVQNMDVPIEPHKKNARRPFFFPSHAHPFTDADEGAATA